MHEGAATVCCSFLHFILLPRPQIKHKHSSHGMVLSTIMRQLRWLAGSPRSPVIMHNSPATRSYAGAFPPTRVKGNLTSFRRSILSIRG